MQSRTLGQIVADIKGKTDADLSIMIDSVCTDTRQITKGCLFIPLVGERFDGHDFIEQAFENGAAAVLSSRLHLPTDKPVVYVTDTLLAFGALSACYRAKFDLPLVGITGSVGKTSTKEMIAAVLQGRGAVLKTQGNFNNHIGLPHTLLGLSDEHKTAVIEMGMSNLGEIAYLANIAKPTIGVITNIGVSHLQNLKTRDNILKAKLELLEGMDESAPLIVCTDNDLLGKAFDSLGNRAHSYGIHKPAEVMATDLKTEGDTTTFTLQYQQKDYPACIPTIGEHNVYNALAAFAVGIQVGMTPEEILPQFANYQNAGLRQKVLSIEGITAIVDCYNASPESMGSALSVLEMVETTGKRCAVLGDMLELGEHSQNMHQQVGTLAMEKGIDVVFCYGTQAEFIAQAVQSAGGTAVWHTDADAMTKAIQSNLCKGDSILFKASRGMKLETIFQAVFPQAGEE